MNRLVISLILLAATAATSPAALVAKQVWVRQVNDAGTSFNDVALADPGAARVLGVSAGGVLSWTTAGAGDLLAANNLSELTATASTARTNLGLAIGTDVQAWDAQLDTWATVTPSANAQSLVSAATYAAMRTLLDLEVGVDFDPAGTDNSTDVTLLGQDYLSIAGQAITANLIDAANLATDSVSADELNALGVEAELEAVLDLQDLQGAVTDAQVPDTITIDLATVATTANAGDSATAFFSSGAIELARGGTGGDTSGYVNGLFGLVAGALTDIDTIAELESALGGEDVLTATEGDAAYLQLAGGTMAGAINTGGQEVLTTGGASVDLHSDGDIVLELGDAIGAKKVSVRNSAAAEVVAIDSDGLVAWAAGKMPELTAGTGDGFRIVLGDMAGATTFNIHDSAGGDALELTSDGDLEVMGTVEGRAVATDGTTLDALDALFGVGRAATAGNLWVADGVDFESVALSGDATLASGGALTITAGAVSADELDEAGVDAGLEAVLDLQNLQGAVTDAQVPDNITVDLAATVTTNANLTGPVTSTGNATAFADDPAFVGVLAVGDGTLGSGILRIDEDDDFGANFASFQVPALAANTTYTLPPALGGAGTFLTDAAGDGTLTWAVPAGSGDVSKVGTPLDSQIGVWTGDGTIEGDADFTFDTASNTFALAPAAGTSIISVGGVNFVVDSPRGTLTLAGVDAVDATTEATLEAAIDSLVNQTVTGTIATGVWQGTAVASAFLDADTAHLTTDQIFTGKKTFTPTATNAGLRFAGATSDPSGPAAGETWYRTDAEKLKYRGAASTWSLVAETLPATLTGKTITAGSNNISASVLTSGTIPVGRIGAATIDAMAEIASAIKSGAGTGTKIITGTGTNASGQVGVFNASGALASTGVVAPASGTLATLAGAETFTNKTITAPALTVEADPTTAADGEMSIDADAWAAGRDALELFDGTASTYLLGALASDTPTNGQVPKWNTGGTITWEDDATGAGSGAFSDGADPVVLNTTTKEVEIGPTLAGAAKLTVHGDADEVQLLVQGNATQTNYLLRLENSAAVEQFAVTNTGDVNVSGTLDMGGFDINDVNLTNATVGGSALSGANTGDEVTATEAVQGVAEIATQAEANAGTGTNLMVTADKLEAWDGGANIATVGTITSGTWQGTTVAVDQGGTGAATLTDGGVLLGSGTGAVTAMAVLADGEMIVGDGTTDPVAESGATLRTSIGVGTGDTLALTAVTASGTGSRLPIFTESHAVAHTLTNTECYGAVYYVTGAVDIQLPNIEAGMSITVIADGAVVVSIAPDTGDTLRLDGTDLTASNEADSTGTLGDIAVLTYHSANKWYVASNSWVDGGAAD